MGPQQYLGQFGQNTQLQQQFERVVFNSRNESPYGYDNVRGGGSRSLSQEQLTPSKSALEYDKEKA